jgi:hypothetical protein
MMKDWKDERGEAESRRISEEMTKQAQQRKAAEEAAKTKQAPSDKTKPAEPKP